MEDWPERPTRFWIDRTMPAYWAPRPNWLWARRLHRLRRLFARWKWKIADVQFLGLEETFRRFQPGDGVILAPNHSHEGDGYVMMEASRCAGRPFYFMVAWQAFCRRGGLDGWLLQRMGCFSVDREGNDSRALRHAIELLTTGNCLVVFPEGENHHLNERLLPLHEGVAFMAAQAQRKLAQSGAGGRAWIVPVGIRYRLVEDVHAQMQAAMKRLEARMFWVKPPPDAPLHERIVRFGELLLTIKEKEKLGRSGEADGDLPTRAANLIDALLARHEQEYFNGPSSEPVPVRVKALRRRLLEVGADQKADQETCRKALDALDDVQLALQIFSYPGDYIAKDPTPERMAETIEKFEEDVYGHIRSIGRRRATARFGEPIDMQAELASGRGRGVISKVTSRLEAAIAQLLSAEAAPCRKGPVNVNS